MNKLILAASAALSMVVSPLVTAQEQSCGGEITNIYMGNGVGVSRAGARASRNALQAAYAAQLAANNPEERFIFGVAYNPTRGVEEDVREVFIQRNPDPRYAALTSGQLMALAQMSRAKLAETKADMERLIAERTTVDSFIAAVWGDGDVDVAAEAAAALQQTLTELERFTSLVGTNESQSQLYRNNLLAGQRVIVVAHSQGNLFANQNVSNVIAENGDWSASIGIVGVATPANETVNGGAYVTAHDDAIIDGLRNTHNVLASNIENDIGIFDDPRDLSNHYFVQSYMDTRLPSRANIDGQLLGFIGSLTFPEAAVGDGAMRVTLEWGSEPDVDLHAYEPSGDHVYYSNKVGSSGELDLDDTDGFGPEHYFVACNLLQAGIYRFGVNYFSSSDSENSVPENARLQLTTADGQLTSTSRLLTQAVGSAGNDSPFMMIEVTVTIDGEGKVSYSPRTL